MNQKKEKGITLIALVITIIVLLILAGVSINMVLGDDGIIENAKKAEEESEKADEKEIIETEILERKMEATIKQTGIDITNLEKDLKEKLGNKDVEVETEEDGTITIKTEKETYTVSATGNVTRATSIAKAFIENNVPLGITITGYDISGNPTDYTTDGKENTAIKDVNTGEIAEGKPQPQTVAKATNITWKYMGIEDGKVLIIADVVATTPTMTLGGTGGYLNGVEAIDMVCNILYSTNKGTARNMKYEDAIKLLQYSGPEGQYTDESGVIQKQNKALTIGEIIGDSTTRLKSFRTTPDNVDNIETYKVDNIYIEKTDTNNINAGEDAKNIVFIPEDINTWLSSTAVGVTFTTTPTVHSNWAQFGLRRINDRNISFHILAYSTESHIPQIRTNALRPVVTLADNVSVDLITDNSGNVTSATLK